MIIPKNSIAMVTRFKNSTVIWNFGSQLISERKTQHRKAVVSCKMEHQRKIWTYPISSTTEETVEVEQMGITLDANNPDFCFLNVNTKSKLVV